MKRILSLLMAVMMIMALVACGGGTSNKESTPGEESSSSSGTKRDDVNVYVEGAFTVIDPHAPGCANVINMKLTDQVYETLIRVEDDGSISPLLATDWSISDDGLHYTFNIREGVKFHNGEELKASDVVFSIKRASECPDREDPTKYIDLDTLEATSDYTVEFDMKSPIAIQVFYMSLISIVNEKFVNENDMQTSMCGTGPYMLESVNMNVEANLVAFPDYWQGEASIKKAKLKCITDGSTAVSAFQSGDLDFFFCTQPSAYAPLAESGKYNTALVFASHVSAIYMNENVAPLDNKLVRQALSHTVDRETMINIAYEGLAEPAYMMAPSSTFGVGDLAYDAYPYDLEKAKSLLAEAGYPNGFDMEMLIISGSFFEKYAQVWQQSLAQIGVNISLVASDNVPGDTANHNYELSVMGVQFSPDFAYSTGKYYLSGSNPAAYSNPEVDALLQKANTSTDDNERLELYNEAIEIIIDDAVYIPIFMKQMPWVWDKNLTAAPHPYNDHTYFIYEMSWN